MTRTDWTKFVSFTLLCVRELTRLCAEAGAESGDLTWRGGRDGLKLPNAMIYYLIYNPIQSFSICIRHFYLIIFLIFLVLWGTGTSVELLLS